MRKERKTKVIVVINNKDDYLEQVLKDYSILKLEYDDIYYDYFNVKEDICLINLDIKYIEKLKEIIKKIKPDVIFIPKIDGLYLDNIEKNIYKIIKKALKKYRNKILIINDNDKYLNKIFINRLDIYRYGNNEYDDIEYIEKDNTIIFNYQDKKYYINNKNNSIIGYIIIGLLFGEEIDIIYKNILI